jgi:hypothetical protein
MATCRPNGRADAFAETHFWRIFDSRLHQDGCYGRFASYRWSVFFIRADANGRRLVGDALRPPKSLDQPCRRGQKAPAYLPSAGS